MAAKERNWRNQSVWRRRNPKENDSGASERWRPNRQREIMAASVGEMASRRRKSMAA